ncbi:uncharacterized protein LAESUDRAFT_763057 [Laetiporus sulphureus 93-53]|uniref:Reverse transcriptase/retrotransposon-derived protein RNase H-like domain-containing protein n=1 Tax=Laetiporus sulphureus 93-53 TaxID=1314785 RepID=A0A165C350_9APHY|nr:uncharacterized protein LAESUDRAFT_763057 [Laetiporus sulphureus 93-53]KZT02116.1 hypothetical protein LAESUDRAFT_763057 [Laetiporus sulphureus 93-53]
MEDLKQALLELPALQAINYDSSAPVILAVDMSLIAVGYQLCQGATDGSKKQFFSRFGSIMLNDHEKRFSQLKLELYGLYRALRALKVYLISVRNLIVEVDAKYIKGMLQNPDIASKYKGKQFQMRPALKQGKGKGKVMNVRQVKEEGSSDTSPQIAALKQAIAALHGMSTNSTTPPSSKGKGKVKSTDAASMASASTVKDTNVRIIELDEFSEDFLYEV